jgi:hypothetical protein
VDLRILLGRRRLPRHHDQVARAGLLRLQGPEAVLFGDSKEAGAMSNPETKWRDLLHNMLELHAHGAVIVLPSGDEIELSPEAIEAHLSNEAERASQAADEAYYGGDGPPGCYGPDDRRGRE